MKKLYPLVLLLSVTFWSRALMAQDQPAPAPAAPAGTTAAASDAAPADKPIDPAKIAEIRKLLEVTDTMKLTKQALQQMLANYKTHFTDAPAGFWDRMEKEIDLESLIAKVIPVYDKYYSMDDLKAVNAFYETPAGKRMVAASPEIMAQSMQIAQEWGRGVAMKIQDELAKSKAASAPAPSGADAAAPSGMAPAAAPAPAPADQK